MQLLSVCLALGRTLLGGGGGLCGWWHGHGHRPLGQWHELLAPQGIDGIQDLLMGHEHVVQSFSEILQQMKAVRDLGGRGSPLPSAVSIGARPIACNHLDPRMLSEPVRDGLGCPIREQRHGPAARQVYQDRAVDLAFAQGELVHPQLAGRVDWRFG